MVLFAAAVVALAWANSPWRDAYAAVFAWPRALPLDRVIQDGLMAVFFFVVGMEIKRELVEGELRTPATALLPAAAALGGMAAPALIYAAFNRGGPAAAGWAIPTATDIAFCAGCLALLGDRVPRSLSVFLTALAIFDDLGGVLIIAIFYGSGLHWPWLAATAALCVLVLGLGRAGLGRWYVHLPAGVLLWVAVHESGVHATIAGVLLGFLVPRGEALKRYVAALHPWVAYGVMPLFALASAGVDLRGVTFGDLLAPVTLGAGLGLFAGKPLGIFLVAMAAVRSRLAPMPAGARPAQVFGVATVGGIGFTVALFIADLAFESDPRLLAGAKIGVLAGSLLAGIAGSILLRLACREKA